MVPGALADPAPAFLVAVSNTLPTGTPCKGPTWFLHLKMRLCARKLRTPLAPLAFYAFGAIEFDPLDFGPTRLAPSRLIPLLFGYTAFCPIPFGSIAFSLISFGSIAFSPIALLLVAFGSTGFGPIATHCLLTILT